jgi:hypothetical protein
MYNSSLEPGINADEVTLSVLAFDDGTLSIPLIRDSIILAMLSKSFTSLLFARQLFNDRIRFSEKYAILELVPIFFVFSHPCERV